MESVQGHCPAALVVWYGPVCSRVQDMRHEAVGHKVVEISTEQRFTGHAPEQNWSGGEGITLGRGGLNTAHKRATLSRLGKERVTRPLPSLGSGESESSGGNVVKALAAPAHCAVGTGWACGTTGRCTLHPQTKRRLFPATQRIENAKTYPSPVLQRLELTCRNVSMLSLNLNWPHANGQMTKLIQLLQPAAFG